jgi:PAS domain S-box-containing protein
MDNGGVMSNIAAARPDSGRTIAGPMVVKGFTLAFLLTMAIFVGLVWYTWRSYEYVKDAQTRHFRTVELSGEIIHVDEVLTMSARMAAATGNLRWERRYRNFEPQLDTAIKEALELYPELSYATAQTDAANIKLVAMENKAFDFVREGDLEAAREVLYSEEYEKQKQIYSGGITQVAEEMRLEVQSNLRRHRRVALVTVGSVAFAMPLLVFVWFITLRILRRYIVERKRAELALRMSEQCFRAIADYSYFWEVWVSPEGRPLWTNPAVQRITGYTIRDIMTMEDFPMAIFHEDDRGRMARAFKSALRGGTGNEVEFRLLRKDGSIIRAEVSWQPIYDEKHVSLGHRASICDVSERKQVEAAFGEGGEDE